MATHGQFGEFNPQREDWTSYTERLQEYFIANGLEDAAKKKAVLLSIVGAETYQLMRNLTAPAKPTEKSFDQLVKLVEEHHHPAPSVILQRFKFASRRQKPGESIATFVSELRRLSEHCNYGQTLDEMLRDRVVCGIADGRLQRRLLAEPELTLKKAVELAQAQETADQGGQHLQQKQPQSGQMNNLTKSLRPALQHGQTTCYRCRGTNHLATECRFKDAICRNCSKKGHIARACRSTPQLPRRQQTSGMPMMRKPPGQQPNSRRTHQIAVDSENASDTSDSYEMFNLSGTQGKPYFVNVQLNNCDLEMEIDTGASLSIMSEQTYHSLWQTQSRPELQPTTVKLHTYTKEPIKVLGIITVHVCYKEQNKSMPLLVVAGHGPSLLGRDWLAQLKLDWQELYQVNQSEHTLQTILDKHKAVFKDELGEAVGITAKLHVSTNTKPYFCRARPVPHSLRHKIEKEWYPSYQDFSLSSLLNWVGGEGCENIEGRFEKDWITPHSTTGVSPAELLMGRRIRSHLDLVRPNLADQVEAKQKTQKLYHDRHAKARAFNEGDPVFVRNTGSGSAWLSGNITKIRGPVSYTVKLNDGRLMRKHVDQIRFRTATVNEPTDDTLDDCLPPSSSTSSNNNPQNTSAETAPPPRRSTRIRHPPRRYADQYI